MLWTLALSSNSCNIAYDNSEAFNKFLAKQRLNAALQRNGLKRRSQHIIVPHVCTSDHSFLCVMLMNCKRLYAPLNAPPSALPKFKDNDSWYLRVCLLYLPLVTAQDLT